MAEYKSDPADSWRKIEERMKKYFPNAEDVGIRKDDTVFIYMAAPVSAILYRCKVTETDIPFPYDDGNVHMKALMKIKLQKRYSRDSFTFERLGKEYGIFAVRGPRGVPDNLSEALQ